MDGTAEEILLQPGDIFIYSDQLLGSCRAPKILNGGGRELHREEGNIRNMCAQFVVAVVVVGSTWIRLVK